MPNLELGQITCPLCKSKHLQTVKVSEKSKKPYLNCEECGMQLFARSIESVRILRAAAVAGVIVEQKQSPVPITATKPPEQPKPTPAPVKVAPVALEAPEIKPAAPVTHPNTELPTMFDALGSLFKN